MNSTENDDAPQTVPMAELLVVVGLPLLSIMAGLGLAIVSWLHGFADLATH